jgi:hypothetical protein
MTDTASTGDDTLEAQLEEMLSSGKIKEEQAAE